MRLQDPGVRVALTHSLGGHEYNSAYPSHRLVNHGVTISLMWRSPLASQMVSDRIYCYYTFQRIWSDMILYCGFQWWGNQIESSFMYSWNAYLSFLFVFPPSCLSQVTCKEFFSWSLNLMLQAFRETHFLNTECSGNSGRTKLAECEAHIARHFPAQKKEWSTYCVVYCTAVTRLNCSRGYSQC